MPTTFVIDRSKWRCGFRSSQHHGLGGTQLLNSKGFMCCLGHISLQLGARERDILGLPEPSRVQCEPLRGVLLIPDDEREFINSRFTCEAMTINDDESLTRIQRERALERLAEEHGLRIEFMGKYTDE